MTLEKSTSVRGLGAVRETLRFEEFPAAKTELYYAIGDIEVEDLHGRWIPSRDVLDQVGAQNFSSADEVVEQMSRVLMERVRAA